MADALAKGGAEGEVEAIAEIAEGGNGGETGGAGRRELR